MNSENIIDKLSLNNLYSTLAGMLFRMPRTLFSKPSKTQRGDLMTTRTEGGKRRRIVKPYPAYTLEDALDVAQAIQNANAGLPFARALLAGALGTTPKSSAFTQRLNASAAYGLTQGGYNDADISLTPLGEALAAGEDDRRRHALVEAAMTPPVFGGFYDMLDGKRLPESEYAQNLLQRELGVIDTLADECLSILIANGEYAGIISEQDGVSVVRLADLRPQPAAASPPTDAPPTKPSRWNYSSEDLVSDRDARSPASTGNRAPDDTPDKSKGRVFLGYVGESDAAQFVASMLEQFGIPVSSPRFDAAADLPLPPEAAVDMRASDAAVLVFADHDGAQTVRDKMLCLLGACSVLYEDRVVIFHESDAAPLPNLNGLSRVSFRPERIAESGLGLLMELHKAGVVSVSA